jgi:aminoacrylate hydrolase
MPRISIGDAELYYEDSGRGEPLLLVPGLSGRGSFWVNQVPELSRDFRVIVHDHRGTGRSTHSRIRYSVEQMADDLLRLMDGLGVDAAHLVGHSTGGAIGQVVALEHPRRVRSLVLSATWAGPDPYFRRLFESRKGVLVSQGVEAYLRASALFMSPPAWISANEALLDQQLVASLAEAAPVEVTASRIDAILRHDRRARLQDIRVPSLVIVAQDDVITPRFFSDELASRVPGAKLVVLDTGGHGAPGTFAAAYNRAVGAFLRAQLGR